MSSTTCFKCDSMNDADEIITRGVSVGESPTKSDIRNGHHPEDGVSIRRRSTSNSSVHRRTTAAQSSSVAPGHNSSSSNLNSSSGNSHSNSAAASSHPKVCVGTRCNVCNGEELHKRY